MSGAAGTGRPGMHTSRKSLQQVRRALVAAFVLGGCAFLLQMVLPLYALHVVESAATAGSFGTLALLAGVAAIAAGGAVALAAARDRILLRAGLWLDHTLGHHMLANGARLGTPPAELKRNADALALLSTALADRAIVAALEAPWVPAVLVAMALLHPIMAAVAAVFAALLVLATLRQAAPIRRLTEQKAQAGENTATWWLAETLEPADARLGAGVADRWERLNRAHIAAAYALGSRTGNLTGLARLIRAGAQVALIGAGAWLVVNQELSLAALLAGVLLNILLLEPLMGLAQSLPSVASAMSAYRQLGALPADARDERPKRAAAAFPPAPRLNVRGPLALGFVTILLVLVTGFGAHHTRLSDLAELTGGTIFETRVTTLRAEGGPTARVHIAAGAQVKAGDLLLTRDTSELDAQIAMLKALAEAARSQLALVGQEAAAMPAAGALVDSDRPKLASLEHRIAELEKESAELTQRLALAEQELARSQLRSPVSGRVLALNALGGDASSGRSTVALEILTADRPLLYRLLDPVRRSRRPSSVSTSVAELGNDP
jgi:hypothetical protein